MPLYDKSTSINCAVICFFTVAFIGWFTELDPLTCCKRAVIAAVAIYAVAGIAVHLINNMVINVLVKSRLEQQQGDMNGR